MVRLTAKSGLDEIFFKLEKKFDNLDLNQQSGRAKMRKCTEVEHSRYL